MNSILALEHAVVASYRAGTHLLDGEALRYARDIEEQERRHVRRLEELIRGLGGDAARPRTTEEYARSFPNLDGAAAMLRFAKDLEERLVRAYVDALTHLPDPDLRRAAAEIAADEAEHLAVVHVLRGGFPAPQPYVTGTL